MMFDTKTNFLSFVDPKLWPFKSWRYQKISKFWNAHNTPPRGPRAEKFWFSKFLPRGYLHAKNDQNRWDKGVKLLWSPLEWAIGRKISYSPPLLPVLVRHLPKLAMTLGSMLPMKSSIRRKWAAVMGYSANRRMMIDSNRCDLIARSMGERPFSSGRVMSESERKEKRRNKLAPSFCVSASQGKI